MKLNVVKSFNRFIDSQDYEPEEKAEILSLFQKPVIRRVFMLSLFLLIWSMIGIFLDGFFVGGGVFASFMMGEFMLKLFLPALIYFFANMMAKFIFIKIYLKDQINIRNSALATIPYAGSAILFGATLNNEPLFIDALRKYLKHQRIKGFTRVCKMCFEGREARKKHFRIQK
jgi:hypothetical protein